ncbi:MAG: DUF2922 domain-containing protein [Caldisericaceae bacterium]
MADTNTKVLRLVFGAEDGTTHSMEFSNPKDTITQAQVQALMQMFITKNIVSTKGGDLTTIKDGGIVERTFTDLVP